MSQSILDSTKKGGSKAKVKKFQRSLLKLKRAAYAKVKVKKSSKKSP